MYHGKGVCINVERTGYKGDGDGSLSIVIFFSWFIVISIFLCKATWFQTVSKGQIGHGLVDSYMLFLLGFGAQCLFCSFMVMNT